ncbi:MAG: A/G-specific adenine glycosylase, partial [Nocardioidaceae bacterium]
MPDSLAHKPLLSWYAEQARDLPWRAPDTSPWGVLVSEVMLQQTPVVRVLPVYAAWLASWPTPAALAAERPGAAVRLWGRLGYPRRALRLHEAATVITAEHGGKVPRDAVALRLLPGVGAYTAAAVRAFAFAERVAVLDTNVRRVLGRQHAGVAVPPPAITRTERSFAEQILPDDPETAASWSVAVMELGALVCTARAPACSRCPVASLCAWRAAGYPEPLGPRANVSTYAGTDRQCRGRILQALRDADGPLADPAVDVTWSDDGQRERA